MRYVEVTTPKLLASRCGSRDASWCSAIERASRQLADVEILGPKGKHLTSRVIVTKNGSVTKIKDRKGAYVTVLVVAVFCCGGPIIEPFVKMLKVISAVPQLKRISLGDLKQDAQVFAASFGSVFRWPKEKTDLCGAA
jgi:hypothetical protein